MTNAIEALLESCERRSQDVGLLTLRNHADKRQAYFYMREGKVYAIQVDGYIPPLTQRLNATGRVDPTMASDLNSAVRSAGGEDSLLLPFIISQRLIADEDDVAEVVRDFFLESAAEALSWENVKSSWKRDVAVNDYPIPPIEGGHLIRVVASRTTKFQQVAESFNSSAERVFSEVTVSASTNLAPGVELSPEEQAIFHATNGVYASLGDVMNSIGLTRVSVMKYSYALWHKGGLDVFVNGTNIRQDEANEDDGDLVLELEESEESQEEVESSVPGETGAAEQDVQPVYYDEPIDAMSSSTTIPVSPQTAFTPVEAQSTDPQDEESTPEREENFYSNEGINVIGSLGTLSSEDDELDLDGPLDGSAAFSLTDEDLQEFSMDSPEGDETGADVIITDVDDEWTPAFGNTEEVVNVSDDTPLQYQHAATPSESQTPDETLFQDESEFSEESEPHVVPAPESSPEEEEVSHTESDASEETPSPEEPEAAASSANEENTVQEAQAVGEESSDEQSSVSASEKVQESMENTTTAAAPTIQESNSLMEPSNNPASIFAEMQRLLDQARVSYEESERTLADIDSQIEANNQRASEVRQEEERLTAEIERLVTQRDSLSKQLESLEAEREILSTKRAEEEQKANEINQGLSSFRSMMGR